MPEKNTMLLEIIQENLKNVKKDIENLRLDVKALQISAAKSGVQTALIWSIVTAFIMGVIGVAIRLLNAWGGGR